MIIELLVQLYVTNQNLIDRKIIELMRNKKLS